MGPEANGSPSKNCPITDIELDFTGSSPKLSPSSEPASLPISSFKFSTSKPCLNYGQTPADTIGQISDEYTYTDVKAGCEKVNDNYRELTDFKIIQSQLEQANFITPIFDARY